MLKKILVPAIIVILGSIVIAAYGYFYLFVSQKINLPAIINFIIILIVIALIVALIAVFIQRIKELKE
jgi:biotin transporter BioY